MKDGTKARLNEISKALHVTAAQEEMCEGAKLTPRKKKKQRALHYLIVGTCRRE